MKAIILSFIISGIVALVAGIGIGWKTHIPPHGGWSNDPIKAGAPASETETALGILLDKTPQELEQTDLATINWACLAGLPGAENVNLDAGRARIQKLAQLVKESIDASLQKNRATNKNFQDTPEFRAYVLVAVLQQESAQAHFAEQYDPDIKPPWDGGKTRPEELFFHGQDQVDMPCLGNPIFIVAVGQAAGLPTKLASSPGHLYARWDDGKTQFNIEESDKDVMEPLDDIRFRQLHPASDQDAKAGDYYHSLTNAEAFAISLQARGNILEHRGDLNDAIAAYAEAHRLAPNVALYSQYLRSAVDTRLRANNLEWSDIDSHNQDRFNLEPAKSPGNDLP